ncbi:DUF1175 family protein [Mesoterricola sediminis]|uniref:DUF1175 family protein n=1 Tax=Mesoterricola sediminis TaxID=2927980 RepID=A0AA48GSQ1_9BACT|nr:DUF1175 family protein [Mesoterricola sediminis]BDU78566.1 hypothetical protein METESE_35240 [Mesoterricola sediminis]
MKRALAAAGAVLAAAALLAPVRHRVRVERAEGNPVQRIRLESRSLLGLARTAWFASAGGDVPAWGGAREGFFAAPTAPGRVRISAWPGFRRDVALTPSADPGAMPAARADQGDRDAFRRWFVAILEAQLDGPSPAWEPAQRDCAGLLRFAFREAWAPHTEAWRARTGFPGSPVGGDPARELAGPWAQAFPTPDGWNAFAKGAYLRRLACVDLGRDTAAARPGDLVFFARGGPRATPDHAMAFVRPDVDGQPVLLYHTGPEGSAEGEVRRVRLDELLHHPDGTFRPVPENPAFLGVYRWKVLADPTP